MRWGLMAVSGLALLPLFVLDIMVGAYGIGPVTVLKAVIDGMDQYSMCHTTHT